MNKLFGLLLLLSSLVVAQTTPTLKMSTESFVDNTVYPATALLYSQDEDGNMHMRCTTTSFEKTAKGYLFVSASHCAGEEDPVDKTVTPENTFFFITPDEGHTKRFLRADVVVCGYRHRGDDFCIFEAITDMTFPIVAIGEDATSKAGEPIINVASPLGLGKQTFHGTISSPRVDRSIIQDDINWTNAMLLQLPGTNGGSSGSAIICEHQQAICGFLVGTIAQTEVVAIPVSRFKQFRQMVKDGKYKWFKHIE
jgi:S1-C subfamily serine protease